MKIDNIDDLNEYLGINTAKLKKIMYCASKGYLYVNFELKKKNGKFRKINAPVKELKEIRNGESTKKILFLLRSVLDEQYIKCRKA